MLMKWKRKSRDESNESPEGERGKMDGDSNWNINGVDYKDVTDNSAAKS